MKVKVIELDYRYGHTAEECERIGKVFEALRFEDDYAEEGYKELYALGLKNGIYYIPTQFCEVVEETIEPQMHIALKEDNQEKPTRLPNDKILIVEDGSVDVDFIQNELGIRCIIYRQGANKPEWLYK